MNRSSKLWSENMKGSPKAEADRGQDGRILVQSEFPAPMSIARTAQ